MKDAAAFWSKIAPKYAKDAIADMDAYTYTLERTRSYLGTDDRVLEMGCGTGSTALLLAGNVAHFTGTDIASGMIDIARSKVRAENVDNIVFNVATAQEATQETGPFDAVLGFNLFHLAPNAEDLFAGIHRMLPAGGLFISKTPCLGDRSVGWKRFAFRALIPVMQLIGKAPAVRFLTQSELEAAITFAGFEIVEAGNFPAISRYIVARKV